MSPYRIPILIPIMGLVFTSLNAVASEDIVSSCNQAGDFSATEYGSLFKNDRRFPTAVLQTGSAEEIVAALEGFCTEIKDPFCLAQGPWLLLNSSRREVDTASYLILQKLADRFLQTTRFSKDSFESVLQNAASSPAQYSETTVTSVANVIAQARANLSNGIATQLPKDEKYIDVICAAFFDIGCPAAMRDVLMIGQVGTVATNIDGKGTTDLTAMDAIQNLFSDPKYSQGLAIAAQTLMQRVQDAQNGWLPETHLLEDLINGYVQAGFGRKTAEDLAFTYLAFYGARGASVEYVSPLATSESFPVFIASYIIAGALGVLDSYTISSGHPYSLPKNFSTNCIYGRPYHFWLSAYYSRELVKMGHSRASSIIASHILGVGYEATAKTVTRVPYMALTNPVQDISNQVIRLNVAMDDAGAQFGVEAAKHPRWRHRIDLDARISKLLGVTSIYGTMNAKDAETLFTNDLEGYALRWDLYLHPNTFFIRDVLLPVIF